MFRGNLPAMADEGGRLKIPAPLLESLREFGNRLFITSKDGQCALVYPLKIWSEIEAKWARVSSYNPAKQRFLTISNYYGQVVEIDGQGRLVVPLVLRRSARIRGQVHVMG